MNFKVTCYYKDLDCSFDGTTLLAEGIVNKEYKYLRFRVNANCEIKFAHKKQNATIIKFTKKNVVLLVQDSIKKVSFEDFILQNAYTETVIRLEKDGVGPYRNNNVSDSFKEWQKAQRENRITRRDNGEYDNQPVPQEDSYLSEYSASCNKIIFSFKSFDQMFDWFSLADIQVMMKEGFQIKTYQKGLDYFDTYYSRHQIAMVKTEEDYKEIEKNRMYTRYF